MKIPRPPHRWSVSPTGAVQIQRRLAPRVQARRPKAPLRYVAGADMAFSADGARCIAAAVLWDTIRQVVVEQRFATRAVTFPYVPGLLSFREAPTVLAALRKLERAPDAIMCDGQGLAHPRRFGIACHIGVITGLPTIGCAKSRLTGWHAEPGLIRGDREPLRDDSDAVIGTVLRTRDRVRCVYVSVGHLIDLKSAERIVLDCTIGFRLPEPTRLADRLVAMLRKPAQTGG